MQNRKSGKTKFGIRQILKSKRMEMENRAKTKPKPQKPLNIEKNKIKKSKFE